MTEKTELPGYILTDEQMDYRDLKAPGKVTIYQEGHQARIEVADFEFANAGSCRQEVVKGMCWARDLLNAAIENNRIVPGGHVASIEASEIH